MEARVTCITLGVGDVERSVRFYEGLGWKVGFSNEQVAFFNLGGVMLSLFTRVAEDAGVEGYQLGRGLVAIAHNVRTPEAVDAALAEAEAAGARITKPAHDAFWGGRTGYFADPDGNLWEVAWNPAWEMDAQGRVRA